MEDTQAHNSLPKCIFSTLKTLLNVEQKKSKNMKNCQYMETAGNIAKSSKFQPRVLPVSTRNDYCF